MRIASKHSANARAQQRPPGIGASGTNNHTATLDKVMATYTALLEQPTDTGVLAPKRPAEPLLRAALGAALRAFRADKGITLRELAEASSVSPGYLSELERGRKEVSSELLAAVCYALDTSVADVLIEAAGSMAVHSAQADLAAV